MELVYGRIDGDAGAHVEGVSRPIRRARAARALPRRFKARVQVRALNLREVLNGLRGRLRLFDRRGRGRRCCRGRACALVARASRRGQCERQYE